MIRRQRGFLDRAKRTMRLFESYRLSLLVQIRCTGRPRFPTPVYPKPLLRKTPDDLFDLRGERSRRIDYVFFSVSRICWFDRVTIINHIPLFALVPNGEHRKDQSVRVNCKPCYTCCSARLNAEERNEHSLAKVSIRVRKYTDALTSLEGF